MSATDSIVRDLQEPPVPKRVELARLIHRMNPLSADRRRAALRAASGCMPGEEGEDFERAVRSEADRCDDHAR